MMRMLPFCTLPGASRGKRRCPDGTHLVNRRILIGEGEKMLGDYTKWKCPICNQFLQKQKIKKSGGKIYYPMDQSTAPHLRHEHDLGDDHDQGAETDDIIFCSVCGYACREPNPTKDIDSIIFPEYVKKYANEGANGIESPLRCTRCLIRYKFGVIRTDKRMGAALYDDPKLEWYRCVLDDGHSGNHVWSEETAAGVTRYEWSDDSDVASPI